MNKYRVARIPLSLPARSAVAIALAVILTSVVSFASSPQGQFEKSFQVNGPVTLEVLSRSGDITVRAGSGGSVFIRGKIFVGDHWLFGQRKGDVSEIEQHPPLRQEGNSIHIDYVNARDISVDYEITVPAETTVRTRSGSGDQIIEGTRGGVDLQSGSGDLKLAHLTGEVRLQTGSGNVRAHEIAGAIRGGAGSGDLEIEETGAGDIDLHTGSGNVIVRGVNGALRAEAGSGDITAEGKQSGAWDMRTGSGNVRIHLPNNAAFDADINTSSGTIDVEAPIEMTVQGRVQESRKSIRGKVHGGGPTLAVRTGSGDIHIQ
jgi:DUF4097 and DUF4098 domain-containing protein YvlB